MSIQTLFRNISLVGRKRDSAKDCARVLHTFADWTAVQKGLKPPQRGRATLLLIRLDEIGDYLLFRNQLRSYKTSPRWQNHKITLLGNTAWRDLFKLLDSDTVDDTIWIEKNRYLENEEYRLEVWQTLRSGGFETSIALTRTRALLIDDLCVLAAASSSNLGSENSNVHASWNQLSDRLYTSLYKPASALTHEFNFNGAFAEWACGHRYLGARPQIAGHFPPPITDFYIVCFVGANTRSRRWPIRRWIELIKLYRQFYSSSKIFLAGNSKTELEMADAIQQRTEVESIAGKLALSELLNWVAGAKAVVTNDTMASHMSVSLNRPTVIIANGVNYMRFSEYRNAGVDLVETIYPDIVNRRRQRVGDGPYAYSETVTSDIASIKAATVLKALMNLLGDEDQPDIRNRKAIAERSG